MNGAHSACVCKRTQDFCDLNLGDQEKAVLQVRMENLLDLLTSLHTIEGLEQLVRSAGLVALIGIVFAETGLLVGFFLPGDSLLVTAGVLSSSTFTGSHPPLDFINLNIFLILAAILGDQTGYLLGLKSGPRIFKKEDGRFFKKEYAIKAHAFYERHGGKAIILARFVPIMRTFVPFIAGVAHMSYKRFTLFNVVGGIFWVVSLTSLGHYIGRTSLGEKLHYVIIGVIFLSLIPIFIGITKKIIETMKARSR